MNQSMIVRAQKDYELLDSGEGMKLERYGSVVLARPDPQAIWPKRLDMKKWDKADATFFRSSKSEKSKEEDGEKDEKGRWHIKNLKEGELAWPIELGSIKIFARLTPFKHTGIFPEQLSNWQWVEKIFKSNTPESSQKQSLQHDSLQQKPNKQRPRVLNLFGYSGGASIVCAQSGAEVTHVDASRGAISWAKENMIETGLDEKSIRWILEDAVLFVKREIRRGSKYDGIIMDPPVFGRGAKGEVWKIERDLQPLLEMCYKLLSDQPLFFILNGYASGYSSVAYANNLNTLVERFGGEVENGELLIEEKVSSEQKPRYLPCGIVARWKR